MKEIWTDPICGMRGNKGISGVKDGMKYYFCSEGCKMQFMKK